MKITAANQDDLMMLYVARQLYLSDEGPINKSQELELLRHFKKNYERAADAEDMIGLKKDLTVYMEDLRTSGVKDWEIRTLETSKFYNICRLLYSIIYVFSACTIVGSNN